MTTRMEMIVQRMRHRERMAGGYGYPFPKPPSEPPRARKSEDWLTKADVGERLGPDACPYSFHGVWDGLVGDAWLGAGAVVEGRSLKVALCWEGFEDDWCVHVDDLDAVAEAVAHAAAENARLQRRRAEPLAAPPRTKQWLTPSQVASALGLHRSDGNLASVLWDQATASWQGTKPKLTDVRLRISLRTDRGKQVWCLHEADVGAFGDVLDAAIEEHSRPRRAPPGWVTLDRLSHMASVPKYDMASEWARRAPGRYGAEGRPEEMLPPGAAYAIARQAANARTQQRPYIPIGYVKHDLAEAEVAPARAYLTELADRGAKARLGPVGIVYDIARFETVDGRCVPHVHPECLDRFKRQVRLLFGEPEPDTDVEGPPGP